RRATPGPCRCAHRGAGTRACPDRTRSSALRASRARGRRRHLCRLPIARPHRRRARAAPPRRSRFRRRAPRRGRPTRARRAARAPGAPPREAARQAHGLLGERGLGDRVEVLDAESGCGGAGLLALAACAAVRSGADKDAVVARVRETRAALKIWFCLDTLEYLRRGGRIGKAQAWLGGTLKIKPILSLEYEIMPVERVRTAGRAFERMVDYAKELHDAGADGWVVQHIQAPDQAQRLIDRCREIFDSEPVFSSEVG